MNEIKIAFFDIDGTVFDMDTKTVSDRMKETFRKLRENGIKICIATGRSPILLYDIFGVRFDAYVTFNGSYCFNDDEVIFSNPLSPKDVQQIIKNTREINRPVALATKTRFAANGLDDDLLAFFQIGGHSIEESPDFAEVAKQEVFQIMSGGYLSERPQLVKDTDNAKVAAWWDRAVDIVPADGGKGVGVTKVLEYFGIDRANAMAFGDGNNDLEMFQAVDNGIAMGNGSDDLKAIARDVCGKVSEDGIYNYCLEHGLI